MPPSSTVYEYVSERQKVNWGTPYTASRDLISAVTTCGLQASQSLPSSRGVTYVERMDDLNPTNCPLQLHANPAVEYRVIEASTPPEATTTVTRYRLPRSTIPKVLPMKEVEFCTEAHQGRSRPRLQPSVTTVSRLLHCLLGY